MSKQKHIVILGAGFGGMAAARQLANDKNSRVTLVNDTLTFRYNPALYRVATGYKRRLAVLDIADLITDMDNVQFIHASAQHINRHERTIVLQSGQKLTYDYVIIALGVITSYFGIPGVKEHAYSIKTSHGLAEFQAHLHRQIAEEGHPDAHYVVVGGGPTGLELAATLGDYVEQICTLHQVRRKKSTIELVEAADRLLPAMPPRASALVRKRLDSLGVLTLTGKRVTAETDDFVAIGKRKVATHTVIWTAGVTNNPFFIKNQSEFSLSQKGKVRVDDHLRADPHVYVIGDNAETPFSGLAQTAVAQAKYVTDDILNRIENKRTYPMKHKKPIYVVPVGESWAVLNFNKIVIGGWFPAQIRKVADLIGYADIMGWKKAYSVWRQFDEQEERCKVCKSHLRATVTK